MKSFLSPARKTLPEKTFVYFSILVFAALWGCSDDQNPLAQDEGLPPVASEGQTALQALGNAASISQVRLEVELRSRGEEWFADEVEIETQSDLGKMERIESPALSADRSTGTVILKIGRLAVNVSSNARFELDFGHQVSREDFFDQLDYELASGATPGIEVLRSAPSQPQSPQDTEFVADMIRLDSSSDDQTLDLNMDGRHLVLMGESSGALTLLNTQIEIDLQGGSLIEERTEEESGAVEIKGLAASVNTGDGSVELLDGTIIRIVEGTQIEGVGDPDHLGSLEEVDAALNEGLDVKVEAEAVPVSGVVFNAVEIEFETKGGIAEFAGRVASVDLNAGTFTLTNGRTYTVPMGAEEGEGEGEAEGQAEEEEGFEFDPEGTLFSLEAMAGALEAGDNVTVKGQAAMDESGAWVVSALKADCSGEDGAFGGRVVSVDLEAGTFTLTSGRTYTLPADEAEGETETETEEETEEGFEFDPEGTLLSLEAMAAALDAGDVVTVAGMAEKDGETGAWMVTELKADTNAGPGKFAGRVASVDTEAGTFTLTNGRTYTVPMGGEEGEGEVETEEEAEEGFEFDPEGSLLSLEAMAGALEAGDNVTVKGQAAMDESGAWVVSALKADCSGEDGAFGGRVVSVDLEAGTFTLTSGRTYTLPADEAGGETETETEAEAEEGFAFDPEGTLLSLEAMAGALDAGDVVTVAGMAEKDGETGAWMVTELKADTNAGPEKFAGRVASVDTDAGTFTLTNGRTYTVPMGGEGGEGEVETEEEEGFEFDPEGTLFSLEAMAGALEAGDNVTVKGQAEQDEEEGWLVTELKADCSGEDGAFGGRVVSVDLDAGTFTLTSGRTYTLPVDEAEGETETETEAEAEDGFEFDPEGTLLSLEAMAAALDAGDVVTVAGMAEKDGETGAWMVTELKADTNAGPGKFAGRVASVDTEAGTFTLTNGRTYTVPMGGEEGEGEVETEEEVEEGFEFDPEGTLLSLEAMAAALEAGDVVTVAGMAVKEGDTETWMVTELKADTNAGSGGFNGKVASVDLEAGTFTLASGRAYTVPEGLVFDPEGTLFSLEEMAEALDAGEKVKVSGQTERDPMTGETVVSSLKASI